jgi:hypothetical protein
MLDDSVKSQNAIGLAIGDALGTTLDLWRATAAFL